GGLGRAVARQLDAAGYRVVLLVRNASAGRAVAQELQGDAAVYVCDVTERSGVDAAVRAASQEIGPPLVLVNAAGIAISRRLLPPDDDVWARTMAVNATGPWHTTTACLPHMQEAGYGFVCNVASTAALEGYAYTAAYCASKHALLGLTRALARDLDGSGVCVTAVCPGFLDTPMTARTIENMVAKTGMSESAAREALGAMNGSGLLIDPEHVAATILQQLAQGSGHGEALRID
ncbi:MAG: SDR family NAD(P)-dependent oxidoreductase, partial [Planctomycetota bacterium]|nr:SDR family NAD(P)-dependent oxidoreductase [Planctomycetota bacterium]